MKFSKTQFLKIIQSGRVFAEILVVPYEVLKVETQELIKREPDLARDGKSVLLIKE